MLVLLKYGFIFEHRSEWRVSRGSWPREKKSKKFLLPAIDLNHILSILVDSQSKMTQKSAVIWLKD